MTAAARRWCPSEKRVLSSVLLRGAARAFADAVDTDGEDEAAAELEDAAVRFAAGFDVEPTEIAALGGTPLAALDNPLARAVADFLDELESRHAAGRIRIPLEEVRALRERLHGERGAA